MSGPGTRALISQWRITSANLWDAGFLDLVEPARITITDTGHGNLVFGALQADLNLEYGQSIVFFRFQGTDEMDPVSGEGSAELDDDGLLEVEISFHDGDDAVLNARKE